MNDDIIEQLRQQERETGKRIEELTSMVDELVKLKNEHRGIQRAIAALEGTSGPQVHRGREHQREARLWERRKRFGAELEAIGALIAAHREEFDSYPAGMGDTVSLADRRRSRRTAR